MDESEPCAPHPLCLAQCSAACQVAQPGADVQGKEGQEATGHLHRRLGQLKGEIHCWKQKYSKKHVER